MAYDKIVDSTQLNSDLTSVANAIRAKGDTSTALAFPNGFVAAIESIPSGPQIDFQNPYGTWLSEIPDLTVLDRSYQVLYFVVDTARCDTALYESFGIRPQQACTLEIGHLSGNIFVADETISIMAAQYYMHEINKNRGRFWICRLTSDSDILRIDANAIDNNYTPIVAMYGNLPSASSFPSFGNNKNCLLVDLKNIKTALGCAYVLKLENAKINFGANAFYTNNRIRTIDLSTCNIDDSTTLAGMFYNAICLNTVKFGTHSTSLVTSIRNMFFGAESIARLDISGLDLSNVTNTENAFRGMSNLTNIDGWTPIYVSYAIGSDYLTHDSLMTVFNSLPTINTAQTLTIGVKNKGRLSDDEIAIATAKGWTVA